MSFIHYLIQNVYLNLSFIWSLFVCLGNITYICFDVWSWFILSQDINIWQISLVSFLILNIYFINKIIKFNGVLTSFFLVSSFHITYIIGDLLDNITYYLQTKHDIIWLWPDNFLLRLCFSFHPCLTSQLLFFYNFLILFF